MVKTIKLICIAGILVLLVLFVIFTGDGRSSNQKNNEDGAKFEQTTKTPGTNKNGIKKHEIDATSEQNLLKRIIP